jgi:hypothetical protein
MSCRPTAEHGWQGLGQRLDRGPEHFPAAWVALTPQQQIELVRRLVARVDYDAPHHKIAITFHSEETSS